MGVLDSDSSPAITVQMPKAHTRVLLPWPGTRDCFCAGDRQLAGVCPWSSLDKGRLRCLSKFWDGELLWELPIESGSRQSTLL